MRRMIATFEPELVPISEQPLSIGERFRANVRRLMADNNLSQQALADRLTTVRCRKVTRARVAEILSEPHSPSIEWIELFARALDVTELDVLLETSDRPKKMPRDTAVSAGHFRFWRAVMKLVLNSLGRTVVPDDRSILTAFIDTSKKVLWYVVCAWNPDFTGSIIDYGAWPDQRRDWFTLDDAAITLSMRFPDVGTDGCIRHGLDACLDHLLSREYFDSRGVGLRIGKVLIDSGWLPDTVYQCCCESPHRDVLMPSRGVSLGPQDKSMQDYEPRDGEQLGWNWLTSNAPTRGNRYVRFDSNFWKTFVTNRIAGSDGETGLIDIYGEDPEAHRLFLNHLTAEEAVPSETGRRVDVWNMKPFRTENHWFDGLVGCAVGASMLGCVSA